MIPARSSVVFVEDSSKAVKVSGSYPQVWTNNTFALCTLIRYVANNVPKFRIAVGFLNIASSNNRQHSIHPKDTCTPLQSFSGGPT